MRLEGKLTAMYLCMLLALRLYIEASSNLEPCQLFQLQMSRWGSLGLRS